MADEPKEKSKEAKMAFLLGVGLDNKDGHVRVTRGQEFCLVGGSQHTHEHMQDKVIRFTEELDRRGKRMGDISPDEFLDIADRVKLADH